METVKIPKKEDLFINGNLYKRQVLLRWLRIYKIKMQKNLEISK